MKLWTQDRCRRWSGELAALADGELAGGAAAAVERHLAECGGCERKLRELRGLGEALRQVAVPAAPALVGVRLRMAAARCATGGGSLSYFRLRVRMLIEALALPMAVGTCAALVLFSFLVGAAGPRTADPNAPDVTVADFTPPSLIAAPTGDVGAQVLVEAQINPEGRVYAYRLLSGPADQDVINRLNNQLLLAVFHPATTAFGQPTTGNLLVSFGHVDIRG